MKTKLCKVCGVEKTLEEMVRATSCKDGYRYRCKECRNRIHKEWNAVNSDHRKKYIKEWYAANPRKEYRKEYSKKWSASNPNYKKKWSKKRRLNDPLYKLSSNIRGLIYHSFSSNGFKKISKTANILGCSFEEFKLHIEAQFEPWMNWSNNGRNKGEYNETWQLDHKIPISSAKTEEEVIKLNHFSNFQPLCSKRNLEKGKKLIYL